MLALGGGISICWPREAGLNRVNNAGVAQLVEQLTCNQQVTSSSLVASSRDVGLSTTRRQSETEQRAGSEVVKRIRL